MEDTGEHSGNFIERFPFHRVATFTFYFDFIGVGALTVTLVA